MDVAKVIKEVFFFLALAVLGAVLYVLLLDYPDGTLWYMSESIQSPIAVYYHQYCYTPNMHQSDSIDKILGLQQKWGLDDTPSDIESKTSVTYPTGVDYYSTNWY